MPASDDADLFREILAYIQAGEPGNGQFQSLALRLFARQFRANAPYRAFCHSRGQAPETVRRWQDVPAAPTAAFKAAALSCTPATHVLAEFRSSGSTGRAAGRHFMDAPALHTYRASLRRGFDALAPSDPSLPIWALLPPPDQAPHSSLSFMVAELMALRPDCHHRWFWRGDGLDLPNLLQSVGDAGPPILLFGTAFSFVHLLDEGPYRFFLPCDSRLIETGGFKGRSRELSRADLYGAFQARLGLPASACLSEYGMCEMASQFYDSTWLDHRDGNERRPVKRGPHWVRTRVIDPVTGQEAAVGQPGALCHFDLANWNSVAHLQTEDWGALRDEGFDLLGRAPGAELRGCSLMMEEAG